MPRKKLPIPLAIPAERRALARMYIDLSLAFHATMFPPGATPSELDANLAVVAVVVMLGHAEGRPMNTREVASEINVARETARDRLNVLDKLGLIKRIDGRYYLEPIRAQTVPHLDRFTLILSQALLVLGPYLAKSAT
ncbi:hypothetical protein ABIF78_007748 [Bradyrhizobium japonicum]